MFETALNTVIDLTDSELTERFRELELQRRLAAAEMAAIVREGERRAIHTIDGHRTIRHWVRAQINCPMPEATRLRRLAIACDTTAELGDTLMNGHIGIAQADELARLATHPRVGDHYEHGRTTTTAPCRAPLLRGVPHRDTTLRNARRPRRRRTQRRGLPRTPHRHRHRTRRGSRRARHRRVGDGDRGTGRHLPTVRRGRVRRRRRRPHRRVRTRCTGVTAATNRCATPLRRLLRDLPCRRYRTRRRRCTAAGPQPARRTEHLRTTDRTPPHRHRPRPRVEPRPATSNASRPPPVSRSPPPTSSPPA